ncbi:hypothetical protein SAMN05216388_104121 [Halorientalis persicus]|jgi:hypothetical protein|uniref:Uncharacterized protein n=1 Tax=Halorientalis persicus TaxID=1367881 RepID=A0A1H8VSJ4_9EURY|nr:hypothetical protein [Halorientalis persicus]SEP18402.1 hypothetical protein SAMN05216388_104121 [Halorientalis persicus]
MPYGDSMEPDILITHPKGGISIEVKLGDTNLAKTRDTAALVEQHFRGEWTHILLLPTDQRGVDVIIKPLRNADITESYLGNDINDDICRILG